MAELSKLLKGNYKMSERGDMVEPNKEQVPANLESKFEAAALKKLGGSIAFVRKTKAFTWNGE